MGNNEINQINISPKKEKKKKTVVVKEEDSTSNDPTLHTKPAVSQPRLKSNVPTFTKPVYINHHSTLFILAISEELYHYYTHASKLHSFSLHFLQSLFEAS